MSRDSVTCVAAIPELFQLLRQFFLRGDGFRADQLENLSLAKALAHTRICARRARASASACATASGPVPPGISRDFMPSAGSSRRAISG